MLSLLLASSRSASSPIGSPPALLAFTIFFYVVVYTMWLKRSTPQNIVIGGAAGAFPPVVGYAAAAGIVDLSSLVLFAIIFVWTPPHFWALALVKSEDYGRAGMPMMPNVKGADAHTPRDPALHRSCWRRSASLPWILGFASPVYGVCGRRSAPGCSSLRRRASIRAPRGRPGRQDARCSLFGFSILYLFLLFAVLVAERLVRSAIAGR